MKKRKVMKHLEKEAWRLTLWRFPKIIDNHNEPVNLLLLEALKIRKRKPEINSREEWAELIDLLFWQLHLFSAKTFRSNYFYRIYIPAIVLSYCLLNPDYLA